MPAEIHPIMNENSHVFHILESAAQSWILNSLFRENTLAKSTTRFKKNGIDTFKISISGKKVQTNSVIHKDIIKILHWYCSGKRSGLAFKQHHFEYWPFNKVPSFPTSNGNILRV